MDDTAQSTADRIVKSRVAPLLYVVDGDADILFASDGDTGSHVSADIARVLRDTVRAVQAHDPAPVVHDGRLVRCEPLIGPQGAERYAVFFERLAISETDLD
jgi:hypothetical protein